MSDDLLERATSALRETSREPNPRSGLTRARILSSAEKQARSRRSLWLRLSFGFASVFVVGTALARFGEYLPVVREVIAAVRGARAASTDRPEARGPVTDPRHAAAKSAQQPAPAREPVALPAPAPARETAPTALPDSLAAPRPQPVSLARPTRTKSAPKAPVVPVAAVGTAPQPGSAESAELALFRRAQALHLAHASEALAAWDDYLRVAEHGVLVPEAKYNRALCLIRLGRNAEARAALEPFARGDFHAYRRREAAALLAALPR
jgi:hypothetical protein